MDNHYNNENTNNEIINRNIAVHNDRINFTQIQHMHINPSNNAYSDNLTKFYENSVISISFAMHLIIFSLFFLFNRNNYSYKGVDHLNFIYSNFFDENNKFNLYNNETLLQDYHLKEFKNQYQSNIKSNFDKKKFFPLGFSEWQSKQELDFSDVNFDFISQLHSNKKRNLVINNNIKDEEFKLKEKIFKDLFRHTYFGNWTSDSKIMDFENNNGEIRIAMHLTTNFKFRDIYLSYLIFLYDGKLKKKWIMIQSKMGISLNYTRIEKLNLKDILQIKHYNIPVVSSEYEIFDSIQKKFHSVNLDYYLEKSVYYNITGKMTKMNIGNNQVNLDFIVSKEKYSVFTKISTLSLVLCVIGVSQTINSRKLIENFERNPELAKNVYLLLFK